MYLVYHLLRIDSESGCFFGRRLGIRFPQSDHVLLSESGQSDGTIHHLPLWILTLGKGSNTTDYFLYSCSSTLKRTEHLLSAWIKHTHLSGPSHGAAHVHQDLLLSHVDLWGIRVLCPESSKVPEIKEIVNQFKQRWLLLYGLPVECPKSMLGMIF